MRLRVHGGQRDGMWKKENSVPHINSLLLSVLAFVLVNKFEGN